MGVQSYVDAIPTPREGGVSQNANSLIYNEKNSHHGDLTVNPLVSPFSIYRKYKLKPNYDKIPAEHGESEMYNDGKARTATCIHLL